MAFGPTLSTSEGASPRGLAASPTVGNGLFDLSNEIAAVIGGTGTIGGLLAEALARYGARVVVLGRSEQRGRERSNQINAAGGTCSFLPIDAMNADSVSESVDAIRAIYGETTVLVNAAGGNHPDATLQPGGDVCRIPLEAWRNVFDLNLVGGALAPSIIFGEAMLKERSLSSYYDEVALKGLQLAANDYARGVVTPA